MRSRPGAYGLHLPTLSAAGELLIEAPSSWMDWNVIVAEGDGEPEEFVDDSKAKIRSAPSGWVDFDRDLASSTMHLPKAHSAAEIVQPFLGSTAAITAHWMGFQSFHAGAFVVGGQAWGILGTKGAGKSSLLAALSLKGIPIIADDVLIIGEGLKALSGPRCVDLRPEAAAAMGVGEPLGVVGTRERWRVALGAVEAEVTMGGWISLGWGEPSIERVPAQECIETLFENLALRAEQRDQAVLGRLMELLALPMLAVKRPREIGLIDESAEQLPAYVRDVQG